MRGKGSQINAYVINGQPFIQKHAISGRRWLRLNASSIDSTTVQDKINLSSVVNPKMNYPIKYLFK